MGVKEERKYSIKENRGTEERREGGRKKIQVRWDNASLWFYYTDAIKQCKSKHIAKTIFMCIATCA